MSSMHEHENISHWKKVADCFDRLKKQVKGGDCHCCTRQISFQDIINKFDRIQKSDEYYTEDLPSFQEADSYVLSTNGHDLRLEACYQAFDEIMGISTPVGRVINRISGAEIGKLNF